MLLLPFTRGQITCHCPRKMFLPRGQKTRRELCFYYTWKFGAISIKICAKIQYKNKTPHNKIQYTNKTLHNKIQYTDKTLHNKIQYTNKTLHNIYYIVAFDIILNLKRKEKKSYSS